MHKYSNLLVIDLQKDIPKQDSPFWHWIVNTGNKKTFTFRFYYRCDTYTVDQQSVEEEHTRIVNQVIGNLDTILSN